MKACVDKELCISCQYCVSVCPGVFFMDNDDKAEAIDTEISPELEKSAKEAESQCPTGAIKISP